VRLSSLRVYLRVVYIQGVHLSYLRVVYIQGVHLSSLSGV